MKNSHKFLNSTLLLICMFAFAPSANSQFLKNLGKKAEKAAERVVERRVEQEAEKKTDAALDSILEPGSKRKKDKKEKRNKDKRTSTDEKELSENESTETHEEEVSTKDLKPWSNYNFVPGDKIIFQDDLANEENGEFPSRWDLINGSAENAMLQNEPVINLLGNTIIVPLMNKDNYLPEIFTLEFDGYFLANENAYQGAVHQRYIIYFTNSGNTYTPEGSSDSYSGLELQRHGASLTAEINTIPKEFNGYKEELNIEPVWRHFAIAFNKRSLKVFVDQHRVLNIPNMGPDFDPNSFSIKAYTYGDGYVSAIKNIRLAEGGKKLYDRIVSEGKFVTRGILFDINKATLKPKSMGVINSIAKIMQQHSDLNFKIVGHTDSDGNDGANLELSAKRAIAVKNALLQLGIKESRLQTEGKGESVPVSENTTPEGKANNRRVEFIKL